MLDIDDFKSVNDWHGHHRSDIVIRYVGRALRESSRDADVAARYGGDELALILPHTDLEGAFAIAERVRSTIEALDAVAGQRRKRPRDGKSGSRRIRGRKQG
jgi:diguanylate cyclase (GGDEF)-like protein